MPQPCSICTHPRRDEIDRAVLAGTDSLRKIAQNFAVSYDALYRHKTGGHITQVLVQAAEAKEIARADSLLEEVKGLQARAMSLLDQAEESGELRTAVSAIREVRGIFELLAKLTGELNDRPQVNVLLAPEWMQVRAIILQTLEPHPEIRDRLVDALAGVKV